MGRVILIIILLIALIGVGQNLLEQNEQLSNLNSNLQMRQEVLEDENTTLKFENKYLKSDLEVGELICTGKQDE